MTSKVTIKDNIVETICAVPRWEKYKNFFHITVFRYLVLWFALVPIAAQLLKGLVRPVTFTLGNKPITLALDLPFSWQLLWLSSMFFLVALAIYQIRCPRFVKQYNSFTDYLSFSHDPRWLAWEAETLIRDEFALRKFASRLIIKRFVTELSPVATWTENPAVEEKQTKLRFMYDGKKYSLSLPVLDASGGTLPDSERGIFWEVFGRFSESRKKARATIYILLIISALLFLIVLVEHIYAGFREVFLWGMLVIQRWL